MVAVQSWHGSDRHNLDTTVGQAGGKVKSCLVGSGARRGVSATGVGAADGTATSPFKSQMSVEQHAAPGGQRQRARQNPFEFQVDVEQSSLRSFPSFRCSHLLQLRTTTQHLIDLMLAQDDFQCQAA